MLTKFDNLYESIIIYEDNRFELEKVKSEIINHFNLKNQNVSKVIKMPDGTARLRIVAPKNKELKDNVIFIDYNINKGFTVSDLTDTVKVGSKEELLNSLKSVEFDKSEDNEDKESEEGEEDVEDVNGDKDIDQDNSEVEKDKKVDNEFGDNKSNAPLDKSKGEDEDEDEDEDDKKKKKTEEEPGDGNLRVESLNEAFSTINKFKQALSKLGLDDKVEITDKSIDIGGTKINIPNLDKKNIWKSISKSNKFDKDVKNTILNMIPKEVIDKTESQFEFIKSSLKTLMPNQELDINDVKQIKNVLEVSKKISDFIEENNDINSVYEMLDFYHTYKMIMAN